MSTVDSFPVAAQEVQTLPQSPDFSSQVIHLEDMAMTGIDTPRGVESFQFRCGIEIEFGLIDPEKFRHALETNEQNSLEMHNDRMQGYEPPLSEEARAKIDSEFEQRQADSRKFQLSTIKNPECIEGTVADTTELVDEFKAYAVDFIKRLPASGPEEESKRAKWIDEAPNFGIQEVINFLIYEEFSRPTLSDVTSLSEDTVEALDRYTETQGWLEFRFGTGKLQTGYYDNEGMSEVRMAPCAPSEAIRRKQIIDRRIAEIASQFGALVQSTSNHEHINLSVHRKNPDGSYSSLIGQDPEDHEATLDIAAGIAASFQDGVWLNQKDMKWDYKFNSKHGGERLTFSPNRRSVRIVNGRLELRSTFHQADQALNWLVSGTIVGLQHGKEELAQDGYQTPEITNRYRVHRTQEFDKQTHLEVQRAFENSQVVADGDEEVFNLSSGYNMINGEGISKALTGSEEAFYGCDIFNDIIMRCIRIGQDGTPEVKADILKRVYDELEERQRGFIDNYTDNHDLDELTKKINGNLQTVGLEPTSVIAGEVKYAVDGSSRAIDRLSHSASGQLAYGPELDSVLGWLRNGLDNEDAVK